LAGRPRDMTSAEICHWRREWGRSVVAVVVGGGAPAGRCRLLAAGRAPAPMRMIHAHWRTLVDRDISKATTANKEQETTARTIGRNQSQMHYRAGPRGPARSGLEGAAAIRPVAAGQRRRRRRPAGGPAPIDRLGVCGAPRVSHRRDILAPAVLMDSLVCIIVVAAAALADGRPARLQHRRRRQSRSRPPRAKHEIYYETRDGTASRAWPSRRRRTPSAGPAGHRRATMS
jgi:hypothetical protein